MPLTNPRLARQIGKLFRTHSLVIWFRSFDRCGNPKAPCRGNRVYVEIISRRKELPEAFRFLGLRDNGALLPGETLPMFELRDLSEEPWELNDLADDTAGQLIACSTV